jgi:hypothetical protein
VRTILLGQVLCKRLGARVSAQLRNDVLFRRLTSKRTPLVRIDGHSKIFPRSVTL